MPREAAYRRFLVMGRDKICRRTAKVETSYSFHYALNNRQEFFIILKMGNCSISYSFEENCLFSGSPKGAGASEEVYTLVETAKYNGLDAMKSI